MEDLTRYPIYSFKFAAPAINIAHQASFYPRSGGLGQCGETYSHTLLLTVKEGRRS